MSLDALASLGTHLLALGVAVFLVRHRLLEVATALATIASQWAANREVGQQRDKLWETLSGKIDENTRETRLGFERLEKRLDGQDARLTALEARIAVLEAKP